MDKTLPVVQIRLVKGEIEKEAELLNGMKRGVGPAVTELWKYLL